MSVKTQTEFLHLAGALMKHFLEGIAPLRHWYIKPNEKSNKYKIFSSQLTYQSPNRAFPSRKCFIRQLLNAKPQFMS